MIGGIVRWVQRALRGAFMRSDALFNRAFGDALDPLYHLGAITFFLFMVVAATGVVLYAFFDTSVTGAYASVDAITHAAFGVGGLLRTVHRHASDAMLLTMLIHMARYFAFDRLRGFRAFSWITGLGLLWLAYVAGVNGYMLPWDRLAQWVTQSSFEWLDWLPGLGGTLVRNVIGNEHVSNRLFSLLVFVHIGVPLGMLLLAWVHVQRVPKASMQPPRAITIALVAMLIVLALASPVASQGPADLRSVASELRIDWFVLPVFALVNAWPLGAVWALVGGATLLLAALPWIGRRGRGAARQVTVHPGAVHVVARPGETLLEAGLRAGLALPYDCRAGGCGLCVCTVLAGQVDLGSFQEAALTPAMRGAGQALMCCAVPLDDVEVDVPNVDTLVSTSAAALRPKRYTAIVQSMQRLSSDLMLLHLALPPGTHVPFAAGQYLNVLLDDGEKRAFSFANAPREPQPRPPPGRSQGGQRPPRGGSEQSERGGSGSFDGDVIELHVRLIPGGRYTTHVFEAMKTGDRVEFEAPLGRFTLHDTDERPPSSLRSPPPEGVGPPWGGPAAGRPILFVAGATGFAPVKSIVEDALRRGVTRPMTLYWGARRREDLYMLDTIDAWTREHPNVRFVPVLSHADDDESWTGRRGLVHEALLADHPDLRGVEVYACGSVRMVQAAVPDFLAHGLDEAACFSDAFVPSARSTR